MKLLPFIFSLLLISVLTLTQTDIQSQTFPPAPLHKFDDPPLTPMPCSIPAKANETTDSSATISEATTKLQTAGPARAWLHRFNAAASGEDVGYVITLDDSGYVYVAGYSDNAAGNRDFLTIKHKPDGKRKWVARYDGPAKLDDVAYAVAVDSVGNVFVGGYSIANGVNGFHRDFFIIMYDRNGVRKWVARYNGPGNWHDGVFDLKLDDNGDLYATGYRYSQTTNYDWITIKYNNLGQKQWTYHYNGMGNADDVAHEMAIDKANNIHLTGYSAGGGGDFDYFTLKLNSAGVKQWQARDNGIADSTDAANDVVLDNAGNVYVTGRSINNNGDFDYLTIRYNSDGSRSWLARYNGLSNGYDRAMDVTVDNQGSIYVTGRSWSNNSGDDWLTIKYSDVGSLQWVKRYTPYFNPIGPDIAYRVWADANYVYVTGYIYRGELSCLDNTTNVYNKSTGNLLWGVYHSAIYSGSDISYDMIVAPSGDIFVTGASVGFDITGMTTPYDCVTIKYEFTSNPVIISGEAAQGLDANLGSELPAAFDLAQNYPNPFNPETTIRFSLRDRQKIRLVIFDLSGKLVRTLIDNELPAGEQTFSWDGRDQHGRTAVSGVYFYELLVGDKVERKKMTLVR